MKWLVQVDASPSVHQELAALVFENLRFVMENGKSYVVMDDTEVSSSDEALRLAPQKLETAVVLLSARALQPFLTPTISEIILERNEEANTQGVKVIMGESNFYWEGFGFQNSTFSEGDLTTEELVEEHFSNDPTVRQIILRIGSADQPMIDYYRAYEAIKHDTGGIDHWEEWGFVASGKEESTFRQSVNTHRHAENHSSHQGDNKLMSTWEAYVFMRRLVRRWLLWKLARNEKIPSVKP